jgi:hypothetical protein
LYPEQEAVSDIVLDTVNIVFKRRLVDRVQRIWGQMAHDRPFPRRDQIEPSMLGEDWANCLVIAVQLPVQLSHFVAVGSNLLDADNTFAGIFLPHLPQVLAERCCLLMEGRARLRGVGILYRSALYPLSEDGVTIDHVLGAANYRPLREEEEQKARLIRTKRL